MSTALPQPTANNKRKLHSLKIDMTPLVDLGFLLITFFIFTATLSQPAVTRLVMPKDGKGTPVAQRHALTLILDKQKVYTYEGIWEEAIAQKQVKKTGFDLPGGAGDLIRQKQRAVGEKLVVIIKPLPTASYENVVEALDEMQINGVKRYAIMDVSAEEQSWVQDNVSGE